MEQLENMVSKFARKHPIITSVALIKLGQSALVATAYAIWPEESNHILNHACQMGKNYYEVVSPVFASYPREIFNSAKIFSPRFFSV